MKKAPAFLYLLFIALTGQAQWSVLADDPRLAQNKAEFNLWQPFSAAEWAAADFASPADMKWFKEARYGMFIHFGLSSYANKDLSWPIVYSRKLPDNGHGDYPDSAWQKTWPSLWRLEKFNADEWVQIARDAGMKYIVVIAKHHDGFHMWNTQYSDFNITHTPFQRDYLKELVQACHKAQMPIGLYYSQRDWYHPFYAPVDSNKVTPLDYPPFYKAKPGVKNVAGANHQKYIDYQFNVVRELLTNYGKIDVFWFDAAWWGGMFTADMWQADRLSKMIRALQPHIIINNRAGLPGDFDTPEQRIGLYQKRAWESAMTLNGSWAFDPATPIKPVKQLIREMLTAGAGNGNVLLSWGAKFDGSFDQAQKDSLLKIGHWLHQYGFTYYGTQGGPWMPNAHMGAVHKDNKVYLYIFDWKPEGILLPALPQNRVVAARFINLKENLQWQQEGSNLRLSTPQQPDLVVSLVELTMQQPINEVLAASATSIFDDPTFGEKISSMRYAAGHWKKNDIIKDLGAVKNITGLQIVGNSRPVTIATSVDGKTWLAVGETEGAATDMPLFRFMTGAYVPGKSVRYIRLRSSHPQAVQMNVYAK